jgi:hypothetical protein
MVKLYICSIYLPSWHVQESNCLLGVFEKIRKATGCFILSVCLSVIMEQLASEWTDFHEICYSIRFRKSVDRI